jgi:hypothetical protein
MDSTHVRRSPPRHSKHSLLIIDDAGVRRRGFAEAEKILKKLDRLEAKLARFAECDQRLFQDWLDQTFCEQKNLIDEKRQEYHDLAQLHNWIMAEAKMHELSLHEAYRRVRDEKLRYEKGSETDRQRIQCERQKRDDFIETEVHREQAEAEKLQREFEQSFSGFDKAFRSSFKDGDELDTFRALTDEKLNELCRDVDVAFSLLFEILELARSPDDFALLLRVWNQTPRQIQMEFSQEFSASNGYPFARVLKEIERTLKNEGQGPHAGHFGDEPDENEDDHRSRGRTNREPREGAWLESDTSGEFGEKIKIIYRKIVRRLHPDLQGKTSAGRLSVWQQKLWDRAQSAHRSKDLKDLERIYRLVLLRQHELNEFTVSELIESRSWLEAELKNLESEAKALKRQPAWGFSTRKNLAPLITKIKKMFTNDLQLIEDEIADLKVQHDFLDLFSRSERSHRRRGR